MYVGQELKSRLILGHLTKLCPIELIKYALDKWDYEETYTDIKYNYVIQS